MPSTPETTLHVHLVIPGQPLAKGRPRLNRKTGGIYTPKETAQHEDTIAWYARATGVRFKENVSVRMRFFGDTTDQKIADTDNLIKCCLDGLQKGELLANDKLVVEIHALRFDHQENPRTEVEVEPYRREDG